MPKHRIESHLGKPDGHLFSAVCIKSAAGGGTVLVGGGQDMMFYRQQGTGAVVLHDPT